MRFHRTYAALTLTSSQTLRRLGRVETLMSVRLEPIVRQRKPLAMIELRFADTDGAAIVPLVYVDVAMLLDPERDVLVWPAAAANALDEAAAFELSATIVPWLVAQTLGQSLNEERIWLRGDVAERELFARVRERGAIGAAPASRSFLHAAPFLYAGRFWVGGRPGFSGAHAVLGAAIATAANLDVALCTEYPQADDLLRWYGVRPGANALPRSLVVQPARRGPANFASGVEPDVVRIVVRPDSHGAIALVAPAPVDRIFSFERADGELAGSLDVTGAIPQSHAARRSHRIPVRVGDSGGRLFFGVRSARDPGDDGDVDEAYALASALRTEGFTVEVGDDPRAIAGGGYDVVHVHGLLDAERALAFLTAAKTAGAATALHAHTEEATLGGWWGTIVTRYCYEYAADQRSIDDFAELLQARRLALGDVRSDRAYAPPSQDGALLRAAVRGADVVFVSGEAEAAHVAARYARLKNVVVVPPAVPFAVDGSPIGEFVGTVNYALIHAPIGARGNQIIALRAAERANIPLVVAGTVEDPSYLTLLREFGNASTRIVTDPPASVLATLYAGATVYLDVRWVGAGRGRSARAAVAGARLVIADRRPGDSLLAGSDVTRVDPGDESGIMRALGDAWYAATEFRGETALSERVHLATVPRTVAAAVASGYALLPRAKRGAAASV